MTCFEATCLQDRALLCDKINLLYMPVYNRDTSYFSSIISSFVRDASCFVAQSNANDYGDSRITGPYNSLYLDIVKLKGGINNYIVIGEIDFDEVRNQLLEHHKTDVTSTSPEKTTETKKVKPLSAGQNRRARRKHNGI